MALLKFIKGIFSNKSENVSTEIQTNEIQEQGISKNRQLANAVKLYEQGNYNEAFKILNDNLSSLDNNADALVTMGNIYIFGNGQPKNEKKALTFFLRASELGNVLSMYNTGLAYLKGIGCSKDSEKGKYWMERAASHGDQTSMLVLAEISFEKEDYKNAIQWYKKLSNLGNKVGMYELAEMYTQGKGCEKSYKMAAELFEKIIDGNVTKESLEPVKKSLNMLATLHITGLGVEKNQTYAIELLKFSHKLGDETATSLLNKLGIK